LESSVSGQSTAMVWTTEVDTNNGKYTGRNTKALIIEQTNWPG